MSFVYTPAKNDLMTGALGFNTADMRVALVMTNTTADTDQDAATISAFTTLDEFNGSGYTTGGLALSGETVTQQDLNDRSIFTATNLTFSTLGAGTRQIQGAILYRFISAFGTSRPVAWIDTGGFPITANGGDIAIQWNAAGIIQAV
jgi:hypothetical protein